LEAFKAASEIWGEALRGRRNPEFDAFRIRDTTGVVVLELPFAEVLESTRGPTCTLRRNAADPPPIKAIEIAVRSVRKGCRIVADQQNRVDFLRVRGRDIREAERTLGLFTRSLVIFEDHLKMLRLTQR
jgi:hypothetical protein